MNWLIEKLLGLPRGFWGREGEVSVRFNPVWPWQEQVGAASWNFLIAVVLGALVVWVYRRDGHGRRAKVTLGVLRGALAGLVLLLLNRPVVTLTQNRVEPSVLAVLIDDSLSMKVKDVAGGGGVTASASRRSGDSVSRMEGVRRALGSGVVGELAQQHVLRFFRFDTDAHLVASVDTKGGGVPEGVEKIEAVGQATNVGTSVVRAVNELSGQRLAGVVVFTDGRDSPSRPMTEAINRLREAGVKVYAVEAGSEAAPRNLSIQNVVLQESAFKGDLVNVRVTVRGTGYAKGSRATLKLVDKKTGNVLPGLSQPAEKQIVIDGDQPIDVDVPIKPDEVGELQLVATVAGEGGAAGAEVDDSDNSRQAHIAVVDAKVSVLYVEGYPRWEYRLLRTELMRDRSVEVSILLTSADNNFVQDGDKPIRRFPESMEEMLPYDVVIIGDVDPRQFTDAQLQLLADFVGKKGGGLEMLAGERFAPGRYRGSPLEPVLPVNIARVVADSPVGDLTMGFRPVVTPAGAATGIFRFLPDESANASFLKNDWQPIFWYLPGIGVKPGAGEALAEHPTETGPDGKKAPILVAGRYGAGRTLFAATDDSWRWRYYTGESVFDTYWVQQVRLLARNRKLGQRLYALASSRSTYELGEDVEVTVRVLEGNLLKTLSDRVEAEVAGEDGTVSRKVVLVRQDDRPDTFKATWRADKLGRETVKIGDLGPAAAGSSISIETVAPKLELADARTDRASLQRLAGETGGVEITLAEAGKLPGMIASAAKVIPIESSRPLWDAPIAMAAFILLITAEWVMRKRYGMV